MVQSLKYFYLSLVFTECTWGQVPLIEFEGKKLAQSLAITRYFAKKFNLVGSNDFEAALTDEYVDSVRDFNTGIFNATFS